MTPMAPPPVDFAVEIRMDGTSVMRVEERHCLIGEQRVARSGPPVQPHLALVGLSAPASRHTMLVSFAREAAGRDKDRWVAIGAWRVRFTRGSILDTSTSATWFPLVVTCAWEELDTEQLAAQADAAPPHPDPVGGPELVFEGRQSFILPEADDRPAAWRPWPADGTERVVRWSVSRRTTLRRRGGPWPDQRSHSIVFLRHLGSDAPGLGSCFRQEQATVEIREHDSRA